MQDADLSLPQLKTVPTAFKRVPDLPSLDNLQQALRPAQRRFWASRKAALLLVFQGLDTSGKDGCIRAVCAGLDPMGFHAIGFGVPSGLERDHDFLWRVQPHLPALGRIALFNRSYYEAVMAERAMNVSSPIDWQARFQGIRTFEAHLLASGTTVLKFWLHIGERAQRARLQRRLVDPQRQWKFSPADIKAWRYRNEHLQFATQALQATHTVQSPWRVVPADNKGLCRRAVCKHVLATLQALAGDYPRANAALVQRYLAELEDA